MSFTADKPHKMEHESLKNVPFVDLTWDQVEERSARERKDPQERSASE